MPIVIRPESAAERPLTLRMRPELQFARQTFGSKQFWAVKDPIALKYFQLRCEEHAILTMLDGRISLDELRRRWEQMFAPQRASYAELQGFLGTLHRHGLLLAEVPGQAEQLLLRHCDDRRRRMREALLGVLAIRFRGIHPQRHRQGTAEEAGRQFAGAHSERISLAQRCRENGGSIPHDHQPVT